MIKFLFDGIYYFPASGEPWRVMAYYGALIMLGAVAGAWLAAREVKRRGYDTEIVWDLLVYLVVGGVIGARLWHVFTPPPSSIARGYTTLYYLTHPLDLANLRLGGLGIPGAVIGGAIVLYFYARKRKLNFLEWADIAAPSVALGQAIGRFGNYFNQELYGTPTNLPWAVHIDPAFRARGFEAYKTFHPLFLYESLWNFANMGLLLFLGWRYRDKLRQGDLLLAYCIVYPIGRFLLDFLRLDAAMIGDVNANQTFMAAVAVVAALALYLRHRNAAQASAA
jgi:phosphatidylglycerol:prolipoprotein diacylglycerol transferase